ncbi:arsenate reductase (glutaredoxin) [Aquimarina sp. TRL1]|uniref:arsenate reductase (glutaredoxin) n=1 Tax=Aquimarina sp. (strain TRL1) TaxID=2736252 RepID=UPI00158D2EEE|nr:arsenate reductase (glutaredoxin) [Aquimarina sp. TRL1]QKX06350.1 arsenate reductase (glutaredoxin) [Aquimarina sp. TRL1]
MTTIYHNPRCSKSRQTLAIVEESTKEVNIIKYLDTPPTIEELSEIISLLGIKPIELIRKNEAIWKENFKGNEYSDQELIEIMSQHPKLIERPIVINNNKAVIGRPPENVKNIL